MAASTLTSWALLVWEELRGRHIDADALFRQASLDPARLTQAVARYPLQSMQTLWHLAAAQTGDDFGIAVGNRWSATTFHALGFAWLASASLGDALYRLSRYGNFLNDGLHYALTANNLQYRFAIAPSPHRDTVTVQNACSTDAGIAALLKMVRLLLGDGYHPSAIHCPHPPNSAGLLLEQLAACPVQYGGNAIEFVFDRHDVERALSTGNAELSLVHEQIITRHLADLQQADLAARVETCIIQQLPSGAIREEQVAAALLLSPRTLQRRLAAQGTSFSGLLERVRKHLADQYVRDEGLAFGEIAYLLGFSEQANFTRAFKRWFGVAPTQYRKRQSA